MTAFGGIDNARTSFARAMTDRDAILDALRDVHDPCCAERGVSVVDMGIVEDVRVDGSHVEVDLVLTSGWCPFVATMSRARAAGPPAAITRSMRIAASTACSAATVPMGVAVSASPPTAT